LTAHRFGIPFNKYRLSAVFLIVAHFRQNVKFYSIFFKKLREFEGGALKRVAQGKKERIFIYG